MSATTRRDFLRLVGGSALALAGARLAGCSRDELRRRPNLLFILADEHRHDALGCAGHPWIRTPSLDRLAANGVRFTNAFVTTSLCSPSRASYLSGVYPHVHGVTQNEKNDLPDSLPTFPQLLRDAGYETAFIGKWHQARWSTPRRGFDHWVSFNGQGDYLRNTFNVDGRWILSERYITDELTDRALAFLDRQRDRPFLLILAHKAAHSPFVPAPRHKDLYAEIPPEEVEPSQQGPIDGRGVTGRGREPDLQALTRDYARTLAGIDDSTGRILAWLEARGILERTAIVYGSDNGFLLGEQGGMRDKRAAFDPSIRVPLLMHYPAGVPRGVVNEGFILNIDLAPTLLEVAGVTPPPTMQGESWLPLLRGASGRDAFLYEYFAEQGAVPTTLATRTRSWKLIQYPLNPELSDELYDLSRDPGEQRNLAADPRHAADLARLQAEHGRLLAATGFRMIRNR